MFKFICVILSNAIHNIFESAINKGSWTKLYMLDNHYECTIVYSCDIFLSLFWSKTGPKYTLNCLKSLMWALPPKPPTGLCPCTPLGASGSPQTPCPGRITLISYAPAKGSYWLSWSHHFEGYTATTMTLLTCWNTFLIHDLSPGL